MLRIGSPLIYMQQERNKNGPTESEVPPGKVLNREHCFVSWESSNRILLQRNNVNPKVAATFVHGYPEGVLPMIIRWITIILFITTTLVFGQTMPPSNAADQAKEFLSMYNIMYQKLVTVSSNAQWNAGTDVTERHTGERIGADQALAVFQ